MAKSSLSGESDTRTRILDIAERLAQTKGFKGFSYADVASQVGVTKASLHYHFSGKAELGEALLARYSERFFERLDDIGSTPGSAREKLDAFVGIYLEVSKSGSICLCGMLAAEHDTLPKPMQDAVASFFDRVENWLTAVIKEGLRQGEFRLTSSPREIADALVSGLEGGMLLTRSNTDASRFEAIARNLLDGFFVGGRH